MSFFWKALMRGPQFCCGDYTRATEVLKQYTGRRVMSAGFQWGWCGVMVFRLVKEQQPAEPVTAGVTAWQALMRLITVLTMLVSMILGMSYYFDGQFARACFCELSAVLLCLLSMLDWGGNPYYRKEGRT